MKRMAFGLGFTLVVIALLCVPNAVQAQTEPDYGVLERLTLPWPCGESYRFTCDWECHWKSRMAQGLGLDFAVPAGTAVLAPADGVVSWHTDNRPLNVNLGNYADLVINDQWLIRFAHLRGPVFGEQHVRMDDLIGVSGDTGNVPIHLHIEIFVRDGDDWVPPEVERVTRLFGLPVGEFVEDTVISRDCPLTYAEVETVSRIRTGEVLTMTVLVKNASDEDLAIDDLEVYGRKPDGGTFQARLWRSTILPSHRVSRLTVTSSSVPLQVGPWEILQVGYRQDDRLMMFAPLTGKIYVEGPELGVRSLKFQVTDSAVSFTLLLESRGTEAVVLDAVEIWGWRPDGDTYFSALAEDIAALEPGEIAAVSLDVPLEGGSGRWEVAQLGYWVNGDFYPLDLAELPEIEVAE